MARYDSEEAHIQTRQATLKPVHLAVYSVMVSHSIGYRALVTGHWLQGVGYRVLVTECWLQGVGYRVLVTGCWLLSGCWLQGIGYRVLVTGRGDLVTFFCYLSKSTITLS